MKGLYGAIAAGALYVASALGCANVAAKQDSKLDKVVQKEPSAAEKYNKLVSDEKNMYAGLGDNTQKKLVHVKSRLDDIMKDGVVQPATQPYEINEVKAAKEQRDRAKAIEESLKGDDAITKALRDEAKSQKDRAQNYVTEFAKSGRLKARAVLFIDRASEEDSWYGHRPEDHFEITGTPADHAALYGKSTDAVVDEAIDKMQSALGDKFGRETSGNWTKEQHEAYKREIFENSLFVQEGKAAELIKLFPGYDGKGAGTIVSKTRPFTQESYLAKLKEGRGYVYVFYVPTKADVAKEPTPEEKIKNLEERIKKLEGPKDGKSGTAPSATDDAAAKAAAEKAAAEKAAAEKVAAEKAAAEKAAAEAKAKAEKKAEDPSDPKHYKDTEKKAEDLGEPRIKK